MDKYDIEARCGQCTRIQLISALDTEPLCKHCGGRLDIYFQRPIYCRACSHKSESEVYHVPPQCDKE